MSIYVDGVEFHTITCDCGVMYALTSEFIKNRRADHKAFHCPNGCIRWYPGQSDEQKKIAELSGKVMRLESSLSCKENLLNRRDYQVRYWKGQVTKAKKK